MSHSAALRRCPSGIENPAAGFIWDSNTGLISLCRIALLLYPRAVAMLLPYAIVFARERHQIPWLPKKGLVEMSDNNRI